MTPGADYKDPLEQAVEWWPSLLQAGVPTVSAEPTASLAFLATEDADPPVTVIREIRVRSGRDAEFERLIEAAIGEAARQPGHLGATVIRPDPNRPHDPHRFIYKFDRRSHLDAWHRSEERARIFEPIQPLIESDRFDAYPGLETWFALPGVPVPPRWKTTLMIWPPSYAIALIASYALKWIDFDAPIPIRTLIFTIVAVPLVSYVIAPQLSRLFQGWLVPQSRRDGSAIRGRLRKQQYMIASPRRRRSSRPHSLLFPVLAELIPCSASKNSLFRSVGNSAVSGRNSGGIRTPKSPGGPKSREFPVFFPVSREIGGETSSRQTVSAAN